MKESSKPDGPETVEPLQFPQPEYAGFWVRVLPEILDSLFLTIVLLPIEIILGIIVVAATGANGDSPFAPIVRTLIDLFSLFAWWLYSSLLESSPWQATLGKKALGILVTDLEGNRITFRRASGR